MRVSPAKLMWTGGACLVVGWAVLLLIVIRMIPPSILLSIAAYALSFIGFLVGLFGVIEYRRDER